jgi:hypothetical protein
MKVKTKGSQTFMPVRHFTDDAAKDAYQIECQAIIQAAAAMPLHEQKTYLLNYQTSKAKLLAAYKKLIAETAEWEAAFAISLDNAIVTNGGALSIDKHSVHRRETRQYKVTDDTAFAAELISANAVADIVSNGKTAKRDAWINKFFTQYQRLPNGVIRDTSRVLISIRKSK